MSEEIWFTCPCPVSGCKNREYAYEWKHTKCGSYEKLNSNGILRCIGCGENGPLIDWEFNCGNHGYESASLQGLLACFSIMGKVTGASKSFLVNLAKSVAKMYE